MTTLLLTGSNSFIGQSFIRKKKRDWTLHATYFQHRPHFKNDTILHYCDLRDRSQVDTLWRSIRPDVVVHMAGSNQNILNFHSIVPSARHVAELSRLTKAFLIHLSTDMVFDGEQAPYKEEDPPSPLTEYGKAKSAAEKIIQSQAPESLIIRTSLVCGIHPTDHVTRWLLDNLEQGKTIPLFSDELRCPIWIDNLVQALWELAEFPIRGILHIAGPEAMSRWEFAQFMLRPFGYAHHPLLIASSAQELGIRRPRDLRLSVAKAQNLLKTPLSPLSDIAPFLRRES